MKIKYLHPAILLLFQINYSLGLEPSSRESNAIVLDMDKCTQICFDSIISDLQTTPLEKAPFDNCINMITYGDYFYMMGSNITGKNVSIYHKSGKLIKELTFPDALLVHSMCIVPTRNELWVMSRYKIINKFRLDGKAIKKIALPFSCAAITAVSEKDFLVYSGGAINERGQIANHFMTLTDFESIKDLYIPSQGKEEWPFAPYNTYTGRGENTYILLNNIDTIYCYNSTKGQFKALYTLDFHGDFLSKEKVPTDDRLMGDIISNKKYIHNIYSFYQAAHSLFLKTVGKREHFYRILLENEQIETFERLFDHFQSGFINPFVGSDGNCLFLLAHNHELTEHYMNIKCNYSAIQRILPQLQHNPTGWTLLTIKIKV